MVDSFAMKDARVPWRRTHLAMLLGIVLLGGILRLYLIGSKTVWLDEAFSIWIANHPLPELWYWLIKIDQHPPLYYTLLSFWQSLFGDLQGTVRTLSALFSTVAIPLVYGMGYRLMDRWTALMAALIMAVSPFQINFAQETRMYALLTAAVAAALYFLSTLLTYKRERRREAGSLRRCWIGFALAQAAVMLTHNTAAVYFVLAVNLSIGALCLMRYVSGKDSTFPALNEPGFGWRWLQVQWVAIVIWVPWAIPFLIQSIGVDEQFWISPPTVETVRNTLKNFNFSFLPGWIPQENIWMAAYPILALLGILHLRRTPGRSVLLLMLLFTPLLVSLAVSLRRPIYYDRTLIWATIPYYLLMAAGVRWLGLVTSALIGKNRIQNSTASDALPRADDKPRPWHLTVVIPVAVVCLILFLSGISLNGYYYWYEKEDWNRAAAYVAEQVGSNDMLLFNATWVQIPFEYYYRHFDLTTELKGMPADLFERGELEPRMLETDIPYLRELASEQDRIWLVYSHDWYTDPDKIIPRELNKIMRQEAEQEFVGLRVMLFVQR